MANAHPNRCVQTGVQSGHFRDAASGTHPTQPTWTQTLLPHQHSLTKYSPLLNSADHRSVVSGFALPIGQAITHRTSFLIIKGERALPKGSAEERFVDVFGADFHLVELLADAAVFGAGKAGEFEEVRVFDSGCFAGFDEVQGGLDDVDHDGV